MGRDGDVTREQGDSPRRCAQTRRPWYLPRPGPSCPGRKADGGAAAACHGPATARSAVSRAYSATGVGRRTLPQAADTLNQVGGVQSIAPSRLSRMPGSRRRRGSALCPTSASTVRLRRRTIGKASVGLHAPTDDVHAVLAGMVASACCRRPLPTPRSPLSAAPVGPATYNTTEDLNYRGTDTSLPPGPELPHGGSSTRITSERTPRSGTRHSLPAPRPRPPRARPSRSSSRDAPNQPPAGPAPLTQIHLQDITPLPDGSARWTSARSRSTSRSAGTAAPAGRRSPRTTRSTSAWQQGHDIDFDDEGGFVELLPPQWRRLPRSRPGAGIVSGLLIKGGGTNNGDTMSSGERSAMEGFAVEQHRTAAPGRVRHGRRDPHLWWRHQGCPRRFPRCGSAPRRTASTTRGSRAWRCLQAEAPVHGHGDARVQRQGGGHERLRGESEHHLSRADPAEPAW